MYSSVYSLKRRREKKKRKNLIAISLSLKAVFVLYTETLCDEHTNPTSIIPNIHISLLSLFLSKLPRFHKQRDNNISSICIPVRSECRLVGIIPREIAQI